MSDLSLIPVLNEKSTFSSFAEFEKIFEEWKAVFNLNYRISSSDLLKGENEAIFKYKYVVFHCVHYGEPRIRGHGKRPNQSYLSCGCKASIRLCYLAKENVLKIVKMIEEHTGHSPAKDQRHVNFFIRQQSRSALGAGPEDEIYAKQLNYINYLEEQQEEFMAILMKRRSALGVKVDRFDPPPICKETISVYNKMIKLNGAPMDDNLAEELATLGKKLVKEKVTIIGQK